LAGAAKQFDNLVLELFDVDLRLGILRSRIKLDPAHEHSRIETDHGTLVRAFDNASRFVPSASDAIETDDLAVSACIVKVLVGLVDLLVRFVEAAGPEV
jgi:hypothetical protein